MEDAYEPSDPDVYKCERTLDRIRGAEYFQKLLKGTVPVSGWIEGPLAEACDLAGVDTMLQLMMDPDFVNYLMDKCMVTAKNFAKAQVVEAGCDLIGIGDAICSQIDKDTYDQFGSPVILTLSGLSMTAGPPLNCIYAATLPTLWNHSVN